MQNVPWLSVYPSRTNTQYTNNLINYNPRLTVKHESVVRWPAVAFMIPFWPSETFPSWRQLFLIRHISFQDESGTCFSSSHLWKLDMVESKTTPRPGRQMHRSFYSATGAAKDCRALPWPNESLSELPSHKTTLRADEFEIFRKQSSPARISPVWWTRRSPLGDRRQDSASAGDDSTHKLKELQFSQSYTTVQTCSEDFFLTLLRCATNKRANVLSHEVAAAYNVAKCCTPHDPVPG